MKFNIAYTGPAKLFHLRRDFILVLKYALEDLGHDVTLSGTFVDHTRFNLIIGAYFVDKSAMEKIIASGVRHAHINTEIISGDTLNFKETKTDLLGNYVPAMKKSPFVWEVVMDNMVEHQRHGLNAHFLRWAWHPKMQDIEHRKEKDCDIYFFGHLSERRKALLSKIAGMGISGFADATCPYFLRNDRISRTKIQLNLIQDDKYTHVNSFRICYLANNGCCIVSENEMDPANYLQYAHVVDANNIIDEIRGLLANDRWKSRGEQALEDFRKISMKDSMEELLEQSFSGTGYS